MNFLIDPVPGAEGYSWTFIQNGQVLWETIKNEQKLTANEYSIPTTGTLIEKFTPGELEVQVKARIKGRWTERSAAKELAFIRARRCICLSNLHR